jgi:hypothetical protein
LRIAIELADESVAIFRGAHCQIVDEGFDLITAGISESGGSAVVGSIGLHESSIELMLTDEQAQAVAEARLGVVVAIIFVRGSLGLNGWAGRIGSRSPAEFLDRTEPDAIGFSEGAVDGASFGDAHLGAVDQGRDVGRISVAVANETSRARRFVHYRSEHPATRGRI